MQLHYRLDGPYAAESVRWRRTFKEVIWQSTTHRSPPRAGHSGYERLFSQDRGEDDMSLGPGLDSLPDLYDVDMPGVLRSAGDRRRIPFGTAVLGQSQGRTVSSDPETTELVWIINFVQWVELARGGRWETISDRFRWSNVLRLLWRNGRWVAGPGCYIGAGHRPLVFLGPPPLMMPVR